MVGGGSVVVRSLFLGYFLILRLGSDELWGQGEVILDWVCSFFETGLW